MQLAYKPYSLILRHVFRISTSSRSSTPIILISIESDGLIGYGEASLPPYLGETQESVMRFLSRVNLSKFSIKSPLEEVITYIDSLSPSDNAAKAALDIAMHDLYGKAYNKAWWQLWNLDLEHIPNTSYTIGIGSFEEICAKTEEAERYKILKVKLGSDNDMEIIKAIRSVSQVPLCVDVNQGWHDKYYALEMIHWCKKQGVVFVEQPMPKENIDDMAWLTANSPLPTIADESFKRIADFEHVAGVFSGVNIKLMKCTGMHEAYQIALQARKLNLKLMLGCMTETSCAISAAAQLAPMVDWADLDGHLLINNDPFIGAQFCDGKIIPNNTPGIGVLLT